MVDVAPEMRGRLENSALSLKYAINLFGIFIIHAHGFSSILAGLAFRLDSRNELNPLLVGNANVLSLRWFLLLLLKARGLLSHVKFLSLQC